METITITLTPDQASLLLLELGNHCENLSGYAIGKPIDVVTQLFNRVDALVPIRNELFTALENYGLTVQIGEYDGKDTTQLSDYSNPTGNKDKPTSN